MEFEILNPWWKGREYIKEDKHIKDYESMKLQWRHPLLDELDLNFNNIFSLRGPRQIGKTTFVKLLIRKLLDNGVSERAIFYWNCDNITGKNELADMIRKYIELSETFRVNERYIFLDEISGVENWQKAIKFLVDSGEMENVCLFLTGSHTLDIQYGTDWLPGRCGKEGRDFLMLPLTFREFAQLVNPELMKEIPKIDSISVTEIKEKSGKAAAFGVELKTLFNQYLITGGFPLTINEFFVNQKVPEYVYDLYARWIIGDIVKWKKSEKILMQLMRAVLLKQGSQVSWDSLAKEAEIKSHKTISSYAEDLENMFVLSVLYYIDLNKKIPDYSKNKKIYFFDPFIYHIFNRLCYFKETEITPSLIEAVVINNLSMRSGAGINKIRKNIFYWKNKKEIDCVLNIEGELFACEIKYQKNITAADWVPLYKFKTGVLATKDYFELKENYAAIPVHVLLGIL